MAKVTIIGADDIVVLAVMTPPADSCRGSQIDSLVVPAGASAVQDSRPSTRDRSSAPTSSKPSAFCR